MTSRRTIGVLAALLGAACGPANPELVDRGIGVGGTPTTASVENVSVHGADVSVRLAAGGSVDGELLAADAHSVTVVDEVGDVRHVDTQDIDEVVVELYASAGGATGAWTAVGALSTLSHGKFLILTLPLWLLTGIPTSVAASAGSRLHVTPPYVPQLYQFARFPQGLPPGFTAERRTPAYPTDWTSNEALH